MLDFSILPLVPGSVCSPSRSSTPFFFSFFLSHQLWFFRSQTEECTPSSGTDLRCFLSVHRAKWHRKVFKKWNSGRRQNIGGQMSRTRTEERTFLFIKLVLKMISFFSKPHSKFASRGFPGDADKGTWFVLRADDGRCKRVWGRVGSNLCSGYRFTRRSLRENLCFL